MRHYFLIDLESMTFPDCSKTQGLRRDGRGEGRHVCIFPIMGSWLRILDEKARGILRIVRPGGGMLKNRKRRWLPGRHQAGHFQISGGHRSDSRKRLCLAQAGHSELLLNFKAVSSPKTNIGHRDNSCGCVFLFQSWESIGRAVVVDPTLMRGRRSLLLKTSG